MFRVKHDQVQFYPFPRPSARVVWKRRRYLWGVVGLHEEIEDFISFMGTVYAYFTVLWG